MRLAAIRHRGGQSLVETALLLPLVLILVFNAVNFGYFFFVALNLATAPRQGSEYSIQGTSSILGTGLPSAADVSSLVYADVGGAIPSAATTPTQVCTLALGLQTTGKGTANQIPKCQAYGSGTGSFTNPNPDPEAPYLVLNRVDIQYTVTPLIQGAAFNLIVPGSLTFHRMVTMRAMP